MQKFLILTSTILLSACNADEMQSGEQNMPAATSSKTDLLANGSLPVATTCLASKEGVWGGNIICMEGDPAVLRALPDWSKPPEIVTILHTSVGVDPESQQRGIGYAAEYHGALIDIEPFYRAQIEREPGMQLASQGGSMLVGSKVGDMSGTYLSLTPHEKSNGGEVVQILFYQSIP